MSDYKVYSHLDHPQRYLGLTFDECVVGIVTGLMLILFSSKLLIVLGGYLVVAVLRRVKKNRGPSILLSLAYWNLPSAITQFFLPKLPDSAKRVWRSRGIR